MGAAHSFYGLDRFRALFSDGVHKRLPKFLEVCAGTGSQDRLAIAEIVVGRLVAHASFACHLQDAFVAALNADFGHRARQESLMLDVGTTVGAINYLHRNLRRFMRPERRRVATIFMPASAKVVYQPLGVVGIASPWNFPVSLAWAHNPRATCEKKGAISVIFQPLTPLTRGE